MDLAKIEQGRTLTTAEIKTLPLTSRNPYNFALLQPGVVGFETNEFGVPRLTANGALLRVNYQVDGSNNTQKDRAGLRQMPMSEVMIREVKVVTTGYAPEFGQTMGLVYNAITPSGTNAFRGQGSYRFQRQPMVAHAVLHRGQRGEAADRRQRLHLRSRRADLPRQDPLLRRLRAHRARSLGPQRDHHHAGQPVGAWPQRAAVPAARPEHRVRDRQGGSPDQPGEPALGALHVLRQLHHRQRRRRHPVGAAGQRLRGSAALDGRAAGVDAWRGAAQRVPLPVRHPRASRACPTRYRGRARPSTSPTWRSSADRSPRPPTRALASRRT